MFEWMDELSELVYVVDVDSYELLFMNTAGKQMFGVDNVAGRQCFRTLYGRESPCVFCINHMLSANSFYTWEITNETVGRHYLLKDKLIDWEGRPAHIQIAFDITDQEQKKTDLQSALNNNAAVLSCLRTLYAGEDLSASLGEILQELGTLFQADRACVFDRVDNTMRVAHEWKSEGKTRPGAKSPPLCSFALMEGWSNALNQRGCLVIADVEDLRESQPREYHFLSERGVRRLALSPLELEGNLAGLIGVINPSVQSLRSICVPLETLSYFIVSFLQRHNDKQRLELLSYYDTLTDTLNRNAFTRDLCEISEKCGEPIGVLYVDVNAMKAMNDQHGHRFGDQVLRRTAQIIAMILPEAALYRIGGDEFACVCVGVPELEFETELRELKSRFALQEDFHVSIGHGWSNNAGELKQLVYEASEQMYGDKKLYYHKRATPKRYRPSNDDVLNLTKPGVLQGMLARGQFLIYMQPKVSVDNRRLIGAEALVRLRYPGGALIPPDDFIPLLEETRLISAVDFYVFESMCRQIGQWLEQGRTVVPVSVNFSRYSVIEKQFAARLSIIWERHRIPKELLEIEITESMNLEDSEAFLQVVEGIRDLGFVITIDDFGVKHANLSLFTQIKFDVLKIDKSLVADLRGSEVSRIVLQSVSDICRKMGIQLIVEGIETEEQFQVLQEINCEGAQGYLFDKPLPMEHFEQRYLPDPARQTDTLCAEPV